MPGPVKISKSDILTWALALAIGVFLATRGWHLVFWNEGVHPVSNDSFYHMARMMEIAGNPGSIHEFDHHLHWPDGMWIVWPWAYDYVLGASIGLLHEDSRAAAAMFVPLLLLAANLTLVAAIARTVLDRRMATVCLLAYALAPTTKALHKLGYVDHHAAEHSLWLLAMYLAILWHRRPASAGRGAALGAVLGVACAFHNGLFILQLPVLAALFAGRLSGAALPDNRATAAFGGALVTAQLLVLLPSHHFFALNYEFFHLSWFHLHVAALSCVAAIAITRPNTRAMWVLLTTGALLALPALQQVLHGLEFMGAQLPGLDSIREANSPYWGALSFRQVVNHYSAIVWLLPAFAAWAMYRLWRADSRSVEPVALVFLLFGAMLLAAQIRFQQYGLLSLVLLPLMTLQNAFDRPRDMLYATILFAGVYIQSPGLLSYEYPLGGSLRYARAVEIVDLLETTCARQPALLVAEANWGNFLRYRTDCPLTANNFIMTPDDFEALEHNKRLLALEPESLLTELPQIAYVLVSVMEETRLGQRLLSEESFDGFELLGEIRDRDGRSVARAFRVRASTPTPDGTPGQ